MSAQLEKLAFDNPPLDRRRVYILPSRYGVMLGILLVAILLGSINYDNALGYLLTFLIGGLYLVAMLHTYRNLVGLSVKGFSAENAFLGDYIPFHINLENSDAFDKYNFALVCQGRPSRWLKRRQIISHDDVAKIPASGTHSCSLAVKSSRRGRIQLPRIKIYSTFPLGIFVAWGYFHHTPTSLVYPRPEGHLPLPALTLSGAENQASTGAGDADFYGLREYSGGEPIKRIAWRALAKYDELLVKQFRGDHDAHLVLNWRHTAKLDNDEARLSQLCLWVLQASQAGIPFALELPSESISLGIGDAHRRRCLAALAEF